MLEAFRSRDCVIFKVLLVLRASYIWSMKQTMNKAQANDAALLMHARKLNKTEYVV